MWESFCSALVLSAALLPTQPLAAEGPATARLVNGGFESNVVREGWSTQGATLKITGERLGQGKISPYQCGQFIEYLCALTPSMFAEKVFDGSFEGVPPYRFVFRSQTDRVEQPWYPDGAVHRGEFVLDTNNPFNGKVSQRIRQNKGDACTLGISRAASSSRQARPCAACCTSAQKK